MINLPPKKPARMVYYNSGTIKYEGAGQNVIVYKANNN